MSKLIEYPISERELWNPDIQVRRNIKTSRMRDASTSPDQTKKATKLAESSNQQHDLPNSPEWRRTNFLIYSRPCEVIPQKFPGGKHLKTVDRQEEFVSDKVSFEKKRKTQKILDLSYKPMEKGKGKKIGLSVMNDEKEILDLSATDVTAHNLQLLCEGLKEKIAKGLKPRLKTLKLNRNVTMGPKALKIVAEIAALCKLENVEMRDCEFALGELQSFKQNLSQLKDSGKGTKLVMLDLRDRKKLKPPTLLKLLQEYVEDKDGFKVIGTKPI